MFNRILAKTEEIRAGDAVRVLSVADMIRGAHDDRPRAGRCACNDGLIRLICSDNLEFGTVSAIKNCTMINNFDVRIYR